MIALNLPDIKDVTSHLFLKKTFDSFSFIEGEIITFNTFRIDGTIHRDFFDTGDGLPRYSYWSNLRNYCLTLIKGKRTPLGFHFVLSLPASGIRQFTEQNLPSFRPEDIQGLYLNLNFDGTSLSCVTGISMKTFTLDKSPEHLWDEKVQDFLRQQNIIFEFR